MSRRQSDRAPAGRDLSALTTSQLADAWVSALTAARAAQSNRERRRAPLAWLRDPVLREIHAEYRRRHEQREHDRAQYLEAQLHLW